MKLRARIRRWLALRRTLRGVRRDRGVVIYGDVTNLQIARGVILQANVVIHAGGLPWSRGQGRLVIGEGGVISPGTVLFAAGPGGIVIGRNFDCGPLVGIFASRTTGANQHEFGAVSIGDNVTVYAGAVISPGVTIGNGAMVAANAVVTRDVAPGAFVGGAPARVIRDG